ncbi:hypothetical protein LVW35_19855 [Pseudomonas sp. HN11]|uniref:NEL-type E3 ubiquitin ligase domain-containing protein n=1 Tax=Pseudomonas sp. HN11 TaxID=1344094 RepID=UPI001F446714|nr:NEL-type E3 ubiquitin ligase domain-containing protein [Pseudomonas sp. HN11]UII69904.1 hypothetical protein LVW35_19855 [Pseudomonas sp. HN11]
MMEKRDLSAVTDQVTEDERLGLLLDMTGDLDKARVLRRTLPAWLVEATPASLAGLEHAHRDSKLPRHQVKRLFKRLQPLHHYCVERLHSFLLSKGVEGVDVERDQLELPTRKLTLAMPPAAGRLIETITWEKLSLVQAAMQNFDASRARSNGRWPSARILSAATRQVLPALSAEQFIDYCRELDLGESYQRHIRDVFNLRAPHEQLADGDMGYNPAAFHLGQSKNLDMQIDLHIACAKEDVSAGVGERLLKLIKADRPANEQASRPLLEKPLIWQGLNLDGACLWGVLVICDANPGELDDGSLLVYMPNEPVRPWFEYETLADFERYLTLKLQVKSYRTAFERYLDEHDRVGFFQRFDQNRTLGQLAPVPVVTNFSAFYFNSIAGKIQRDALALAVPTAEVDAEADSARWAAYLDAGLDLLNVAAFVVPVLGHLMLGVAVGQLLGEVFDGVQDWTHDDDAEALRHLINIGEGLAAMAVFAAGGRVVGALKKRVTSVDFFDKVEAISSSDYQSRLWRRRLAPYEQTLPPEPWVADSRGIHQAKGKSWVRIDGAVYTIAFDPGTGQWRINHPLRSEAYRPPLNHNHRGGWQHAFERPEQWRDLRYNLARLDPQVQALSPEDASSIAAITDLHLSGAQRLALEHEPLPQRFQDCLVRFEQHRRVASLIGQLERGEVPSVETSRTQMLAIPLMPGWPKGRFIELLDDADYVLDSYPDVRPFDYEDLSVHLTQQQLRQGQVMPTVLQALSAQERETLLGEAVALEEASAVLRRCLVPTLKAHQQALTQKLFMDQEGTALGELLPIKNAYPQLSDRVAWDLLCESSHRQRQRLRATGRAPLSLAERARAAVARTLEDRALTGLYLPEQALPSTQRVALGVVQHLPGWPRDFFLQLRQHSVGGEVRAQVGSPTATVQRTLVQTAEGFQAYDTASQPVARMAGGPHGFYRALIDALPMEGQADMGLSGDAADEQLLTRIRLYTEGRRRRVTAYLDGEPQPTESEVLPCVQGAPPAAPTLEPALLRKLRALYPLLNDADLADLINGAGDDHLKRATVVEKLEQQYASLRRALKFWRSDRSAHDARVTPRWDYRLSRHQVARAIERGWRRMTSRHDHLRRMVPGLTLDGMLSFTLPTLPPQANFEHIGVLSLVDTAQDDAVAYFLKHFKRLKYLNLARNRISRLPQVLLEMPQLEFLCLADNALQLTEYSRATLAKMTSLQVLNLNNNPLLDEPDVSGMFVLRELMLRNCRLKAFPKGVSRLIYLESLDLRENEIRELPEWLFQMPRRFASTVNLRHNPLDEASQQRLRDYRTAHGVGMGYLEDDIARMTEQAARDLWLGDQRTAGYAEKDLTWSGLRDEPGSDGLFNLLSSLGGTADASKVREDMDRRVWRVLDAAATDGELREKIFQRAATPVNCDDAAAVSFSNLEVLVEIRNASRLAEDGRLTAPALLKLARGLFRLDQLERLAYSHSLEHPSADPLEVHLAYRTGLADRFDLPGQPKHMRFAQLGGVSAQHLNDAEDQVKSAELSSKLLSYLVDLPFWEQHLKRTHADEFSAMNAPFDHRYDAVFKQRETLTDAAYNEQMKAIQSEHDQAERALLERLTQSALRQSEQGGCALP